MLNKHLQQHRMSAAARQRQLLAVAMNTFSRRGFKGTTTKEIAAAAGVSEAVIFQHFPSKEALYSAVLELHLDSSEEQRWSAEINACMDRDDDEGFFRLFMQRILHNYRRDPSLERVILFAALEGHEQGLARLRELIFPTVERVLGYIARRQRQGALIDCNPHVILIALSGMAREYGVLTRIIRAPIPDIPDEKMAQLFTRILLNGVHETTSANMKRNKRRKPTNNRKAKR